MSRKPRRFSPSMVVALIGVILGLTGTGLAAVGLSGKQKREVRKIAATQADDRTREVFRKVQVGDAEAVAKLEGFKLVLDCTQTSVYPYFTPPPGTPIDGAAVVYDDDGDGGAGKYYLSNVYEAGGRLDLTASGGDQQAVSTFAITTGKGKTLSGVVGYDYPGVEGIFGGDLDHCVVYGHISVD